MDKSIQPDASDRQYKDGEMLPYQQQIAVTAARYFRCKVAVGRVLAAVLLIPGLPVMALLILIVRLSSKGPGIYRQVRVGAGGRIFHMYKIRTMRNDAEVVTGGPAWTSKDDPRITAVGRILRKLHLDEFPQLFNVLRGEMCLIGPRPERPEFTEVLAREIPGYLNRLAVAPGITGLAQINLPPDSDLDSVRRKLVLDLEYVCHANLLLDIRMIACTFLRLCGLRGEYAMNLLRLKRRVYLEDYRFRADGPPQPLVKMPAVPAPAAMSKEKPVPLTFADRS